MTQFQFHLVLPVFALVLLTFLVLLTLGRSRFKAIKSRRFDLSYYKLYRGNDEPDDIRQISRNLVNLFETPVIFYLGIILAILLGVEQSVLIYLAWIYVALRYLHSFIHCTSNKVRLRFNIYLISVVFLIGFWVMLFVALLSQPLA